MSSPLGAVSSQLTALVAASSALVLAACAHDSPTSPANIPLTPKQITLDYSACSAANRPLWVGFQDGTAAWTQVLGVNNVYTMSLTAAKGGYAVVTGTNLKTISTVQFTRDEFAAATTLCAATTANTKTVAATIAGIT